MGKCATDEEQHHGESELDTHRFDNFPPIPPPPLPSSALPSPPHTSGLLGHFRPSVPIARHELESRGMWDLERLTQPYIRWHILKEAFGSMAAEVWGDSVDNSVGESVGLFPLSPRGIVSLGGEG